MPKNKKIPANIREAARALLAPFGVDLDSLLTQATHNTNKDSRNFLEVTTVAKDYGIGRWTIGRLIKKGVIKAAKLSNARSGKVLVDRHSLENYLMSKTAIAGGANA